MLFDDLAFESKETEENFHLSVRLEYIIPNQIEFTVVRSGSLISLNI
jgi:hypothetical protein